MIFRSYGLPPLEERKLDASSRSMAFVASTATRDAHGTVIDQNWRLDRYRNNPVVLFEHGSGSSMFGSTPKIKERIPIATAKDIKVEGDELKFKAVFPDAGRDENADAVWAALEDGRLNAVSVGFRAGEVTEVTDKKTSKTYYRISSPELFEISIVAVPSNPDAVAERSMLSAWAQPTRAAEAQEKQHVNITELLAKRFACEPNDAELLASLDKLEARNADLGAVLGALSLEATATQADATRAVVKLTERAALADKLEPQLVEAHKELAARDDSQALREVDWLLKRGKSYGLSLDEKSRKALTAYRRSDPKSFAEDYSVALEGFRNFDDSKLFEATVAAPVATSKPTPTNDSLEERAAAWATKRDITKSQALAEVVRGADRV